MGAWSVSVARAAQRERSESSTANRIAARRRETTGERSKDASLQGGKAKGAKAKGRGRPSTIGRMFKLLVLIAAFLCIGFFVVLVVDVGATLVGSVKLGQGTTVAALWDKVIARVLDEDVPRPPPPSPSRAASKPPRPRATPAARENVAERAPVQAARPEDDARHVEPRRDPEVDRAKQRLNEILQGI